MNMDVKACIELLLNRINTRKQFVGGVFGGFTEGTAGNMYMQQRDANAAISLWHEKHDTTGLKQLAATLQAYGNLTNDEFQQVMETLEGVK